MTYTIEQITENRWGLYDSKSDRPDYPVVTCHNKDVLEQVKKDFIQSDKAEAKKKRKRGS